MEPKNVLQTVLASVSAGIAGSLVYYYLKTKSLCNLDGDAGANNPYVLNLEIAKETAAIIIGSGGANVKAIESQTNTCISFVDPGGPSRICIIRGKKEDVKEAEECVLHTIKQHGQTETFELHASQKIIARLSAHNHEKLHFISATSKARVYIDRIRGRPESLLIRGTREQIEAAKDLLKQLAIEEEMLESQLKESIATRHPKGSPKTAVPVDDLIVDTKITHEEIVATSSDGYSEIMVSSVQNPHKFFIQLVGPRSIELDKLVEEMTDYYSDESTKRQPIPKVEVGSLVAALFSQDNCWYRGKVLSHDSHDNNETSLLVEFVDFGDWEQVKLCDTAKLRPDFLTLRFQAIECRLANFGPIGCEWSEEAVEDFEALVHCAQWKIIMARVEYHEHISDKSVPCVKLVDTSGERDIDIAQELIKRNLGSSTWNQLKTGSQLGLKH